MSLFQEPHPALGQFSGFAPLFPLPDTVLFPGVLLPLHVFESRYREMVSDALESDRLIAMALFEPGWEDDYESKTAAIRPMVCLGRIETVERHDDGRYNLVLEGLSRARVVKELSGDEPYRVGRLELVPDADSDLSSRERINRQRELLVGFQQLVAGFEFDDLFHQSLDAELPLGGLSDVLAHSLGLDPVSAQEILEERNVVVRSRLVLRELRERLGPVVGGPSTWPPSYSLN